MSSDDLIISQFNFDQLLISSIDTLRSTAIEKCLHADQALLKMYSDLKKFGKNNLGFVKHKERLEFSDSQIEE